MRTATLTTAIRGLNSGQGRVGAIDVGFGYTKWAKSPDGNGEPPSMGLFPSLAPELPADGTFRSNGPLTKRDTVVVEANGRFFEVGPDAELAQRVKGSRVLSDNYVLTDDYLALLKGALAYMEQSHYALLVLGLPVKHMRNADKIEALKSLAKGTHQIDGRTVTVEDVVVMHQPLGGLFEHLIRNNLFQEMRGHRILTLDPGQYSFDWVVTVGSRPEEDQCDSHQFSMRKVLTQLERSISSELGIHFSGGTLLERAVATGSIRLRREDYSIEHFVTNDVKAVMREAVQKALSSIDDHEKFEEVVVVGGGGSFFQPVIQEFYPRQPVQVSPRSISSNVLGLLFAGIIRQHRAAAA